MGRPPSRYKTVLETLDLLVPPYGIRDVLKGPRKRTLLAFAQALTGKKSPLKGTHF
jgi:hypothetical protein